MVLSIGMIVKNEEKYLERCLTALKPILENVDSELIIADTGSTDKTVEIAKKFTDNVFYFEWINDFAAARNSTLERARGEWYMFIDADEIVRDCADIIRFFKTGEYKKYGSAVYVQRSYTDSAKPDLFLDLKVYRLTAVKNGVKFIKPIHENLSPAITPCKNLDLIADHYGYVLSDNGIPNEFAKNKSERNLKILREELAAQEASGNINYSIYSQIADCYHIIGEKETALEYLDKGMESTDPGQMTIIMYYSRKLALLCDLNRPVEAIELCDKYFSKENAARTKTLATDCYVYLIRAMSSFALRNFDKAITDFALGFDLYGKYINNQIFTEDLLVSQFRVTIPLIKACCELFYNCCYNTGKYEEALETLKKFPVKECLPDRTYMLSHLLLRVEVMEHTSFSPLAELYNKLDDYNKKQLITIMRWHLFKTDKPESAVKSLKSIANGGGLEDTVDIFRHFLVKKDLTPEAVKEYISKHGAFGNEDVWVIMMLSDFDITPFINADNFDPEQCVCTIYRNYKSSQSSAGLFADYDIDVLSPQGLEKAAGVYGWAMFGALQNQVDVSPLFEKFGLIGMKWYNNYPDTENIPGDIKAALIVNGITSARKNGNYALCTSEMNRLTSLCPPLAPIVSDYSKSLQKEIKSAPSAPDPEFTKLAEQLKQNMRMLIGAGDIASASDLIGEYEKLCPNDPEISVLKKQIEAEK